ELGAERLVGLEVALDHRGRVALGDLLDVHAAHPREHREQLLLAAVEDHGGVVLGGDVRGALDPEVVDGEPADVHAEDRLGVHARLGLVLGDLDATGLAALADRDLRLDDAGVADLVRGGHGVVHRVRVLAARHGDAVLREQLLALILEKIHSYRPRPCPAGSGRAVRQTIGGALTGVAAGFWTGLVIMLRRLYSKRQDFLSHACLFPSSRTSPGSPPTATAP